MGLIIVMGFYYANDENWTKKGGFLPYGFGGVIAGKNIVFITFFLEAVGEILNFCLFLIKRQKQTLITLLLSR